MRPLVPVRSVRRVDQRVRGDSVTKETGLSTGFTKESYDADIDKTQVPVCQYCHNAPATHLRTFQDPGDMHNGANKAAPIGAWCHFFRP